MITTNFESVYWQKGILHVAGVDEAGRGPLAGPVVASAVILSPDIKLEGVDDSKKLSKEKRELAYNSILEKALSIGVGIISHVEIDEINILRASFKAMHVAISKLHITPQQLLIDGNRFDKNGIPYQTIVQGDGLSLSIAAASIIAKVTRDRLMIEVDAMYPEYGFAKHKGYATREHVAALSKYGMCEIHRRSFHLKNKQLHLFHE